MLVIRDTRESGEMLEAAVAAGVAAAGGEALLGGVLPTPGAPLLIGRYGLDLGVVISASHNPYRDNGIKFFGGDGFKLSDETELEIEEALDGPPADARAASAPSAACTARSRTTCAACTSASRASTSPAARILLDCAHGATYRAAPEIFRRLGAEVDVLAADPDGQQHQRRLRLDPRRAPRRHDDRGPATTSASRSTATATACWPSTAPARVVDGDELIALAALHLREADRLPGNGVAVTVMTNYGFHTAMRAAGVEVATTPVGDRYVLEALRERGWALGGEQSGHIIDMGFVPSGDGIAAALLTLEALAGADLAERHGMEKLPQQLVNVRMADRAALAAATAAAREAIEREAAALEGRGRVLVRPSGTEPLVRVMVEAPTAEEADATCERLVAAVESSA